MISLKDNKTTKDLKVIRESSNSSITSIIKQSREKMINFLQFLEQRYQIKIGYDTKVVQFLIDILVTQEEKKIEKAKKRTRIKIKKIATLNEYEEAKYKGIGHVLDVIIDYALSGDTIDKLDDDIREIEHLTNPYSYGDDYIHLKCLKPVLYGFKFAVVGYRFIDFWFYITHAKKIKSEFDRLKIDPVEVDELLRNERYR